MLQRIEKALGRRDEGFRLRRGDRVRCALGWEKHLGDNYLAWDDVAAALIRTGPRPIGPTREHVSAAVPVAG